MGKISNKDLANALCEKHGLGRKDAEKFVSEMFDVLIEGLQREKQVKIKGLGTFKVVGIAARKSIDVNTGQPITIEGRDKITFTPESSLRDKVNSPFAQFDTVVINDGVDFTEIDKASEVQEEAQAEDEQESSNEPEQPVEAEETKAEDEPEAEDGSAKEQPAAVIEPAEPEVVGNGSPEPQPQQEEAQVEPEEEGKTVEAHVEEEEAQQEPEEEAQQKPEEEVSAEEPTEETAAEEPEEDASEDEEEADEDVGQSISRKKLYRWLIACAAIAIVVIGGGAYYFFHQLQLRDNRISHLEALVTNSKKQAKTVSPAKAVTAKPANKPVAEGNKATPAKATPTAEKATGKVKEGKKAEKKVEAREAPAAKKAPDYNKDPRIRTGAYDIVGIDKTVTVKGGQTLTGISRSYLGPGMECYVEAVNGGRTEFKAGEKINIPKVQLKKRRKKQN